MDNNDNQLSLQVWREIETVENTILALKLNGGRSAEQERAENWLLVLKEFQLRRYGRLLALKRIEARYQVGLQQ